MGRSPFPSQIRLLRSMYPSEPALQSCSPTNPFIAVQIPPAAVQLMTLVHAGTPTVASLQSTWAIVDGANTSPKAAPGQTTTNTNNIVTDMATGAQGVSSSFGNHATETAKDRPGKTTRVHIATTHASEHQLGWPNGAATATELNSFETVVGSSKDLVASASSDTVATGSSQTVEQLGSKSLIGSSAGDHGLSLETLSGSRVLVDDHTLAMNSTITLGSGSVITRLALATDAAGITVGTGRFGNQSSGN